MKLIRALKLQNCLLQACLRFRFLIKSSVFEVAKKVIFFKTHHFNLVVQTEADLIHSCNIIASLRQVLLFTF